MAGHLARRRPRVRVERGRATTTTWRRELVIEVGEAPATDEASLAAFAAALRDWFRGEVAPGVPAGERTVLIAPQREP